MPMVQVPVDVSYESNPDRARGLVARRERHRREVLEENRRLAAENARLSEENHALREAASLWIRLYEKQLERANAAVSTSASTGRSQE